MKMEINGESETCNMWNDVHEWWNHEQRFWEEERYLYAKIPLGSQIRTWLQILYLGWAISNTDLCILGHAFGVFNTQSIKGGTNCLCSTGIPSCFEVFFFDQFYPMPVVGQRLEESKSRGALKDGLKLPIAVCRRQTPLDFCQVQSRQSGDLGPSCTMQAYGGLSPGEHEHCEVQRFARRKKHTEHKAVSFCSCEF